MRRLDQYLANLGYCSRSEARAWLGDGRVTVEGRTADDPGEKCAADAVRVDGEPLDHPEGLLLLLHKPLGVVCSHEVREGPRIYDLLPPRWQRRNPQITSIGRLDQDTSGLLLLTDQTGLVHRLTSPKHKVPKIYQAILDRDVPESAQSALSGIFASGTLTLSGEKTPCLPVAVSWKGLRNAEVILIEGRYHQVRRMFASQELTVKSLHRSKFGSIELGDLSPGEWRKLPLNTVFL